MLSREQILDLLRALDAELRAIGSKGEICLYGGTVMCLVYNSRPATRFFIEEIFQHTP